MDIRRRVHLQVLRRHKFALVIGMVIAIYLLYLVAYAMLQYFHYARLTYGDFKDRKLAF